MTKVIAYSGLGNTGKSTEVEVLGHELSGRIIFPEIARQLFDLLPSKNNGVKDLTLFQTAIRAMEKERISKITSKVEECLAKYIIVDRPYHDSVLYNAYNRELGLSGLGDDEFDTDIYDDVVLFSKPFKTQDRFNQYEEELFQEFFTEGIRKRYGDKVIEFDNAGDSCYKERRQDTLGV